LSRRSAGSPASPGSAGAQGPCGAAFAKEAAAPPQSSWEQEKRAQEGQPALAMITTTEIFTVRGEPRLCIGRPTSVTDGFCKRMRKFWLLPGVGVVILLSACGSVTAPGVTPASPAAGGPTKKLPASARVLVVTYSPESGSQSGTGESVSISNSTSVRKVSALIDGLSPVASNAAYSCPAHTGGAVDLTFKSSPSGKTLATAKFNRTGCPAMSLIVAGAPEYLNVSSAFASQILQIAGIKVPGGG